MQELPHIFIDKQRTSALFFLIRMELDDALFIKKTYGKIKATFDGMDV